MRLRLLLCLNAFDILLSVVIGLRRSAVVATLSLPLLLILEEVAGALVEVGS